ncbi:MAG: hypothetical protein SOZ40_05220 [Ezakiella sp.]|nr:hypothetical protein [Ezakiella sp.]
MKKFNIKRFQMPIFMGTFMSIAMSFLNTGTIKFPNIFKTIALQIIIACIASIIIPVGPYSFNLTKKIYKDNNLFIFTAISTLLPAIFFTLIMSFSGQIMATGYHQNFWRMYFYGLPRNILMGYIASYIFSIIINIFIKNNK